MGRKSSGGIFHNSAGKEKSKPEKI
jgi:hypothetical protein